MFGQVVVDDKYVFALGHELFGHGTARVRGDVLHRSGVCGAGGYDDGVFHRAVLFQNVDHLGHLALFLADGDVNADQVAALLVNDGIQGYGGFACGPVADYQLPLTAADGNHGVNSLDTGLYRCIHGLPGHYVGSDLFNRASGGGIDRPFSIQGIADGVHHPADQCLAHRDLNDSPGGADPVSFLDHVGVT